MYKSKFLSLLTAAILVGGVLTSATAQRKLTSEPIQPPVPLPTLSGPITIDVQANELSDGETTFDGSVYGWTCYGVTSGDLSGHIFMSINYGPAVPSLSGGEVRQVTGGSWSKLIYSKGVYMGSIYGRISGGEMASDNSIVVTEVPLPVTINLELTADGGTGIYAGNVGEGSFKGQYGSEEKSANVVGTLTLNY